jgi:hypothetical protein
MKITKELLYPYLEKYYESVGRVNPPQYREYSLKELIRCIKLFRIKVEK